VPVPDWYASCIISPGLIFVFALALNATMTLKLRCAALGHVGWGVILLLAAGWFAVSTLRTIPYMSSGTVWINTVAALLVASTTALPVAALGVWMLVLGRGLWSAPEKQRIALLWTHGVLLALGSLAVAVGILGVRAAERSSARGGGLLGPVAVIPLMFGTPVVLLAVISIVVALRMTPGGNSDPGE